MKMKWKFFILMIGLSLTLAIFNAWAFNIPTIVILAPLILGSLIISVSSLIQIGIVAIVWVLFFILVIGGKIPL